MIEIDLAGRPVVYWSAPRAHDHFGPGDTTEEWVAKMEYWERRENGCIIRGDATGFEEELSELINRHSLENESNTPDWILAEYMLRCLDVFTVAVQRRETWYGRNAAPWLPGELLAGSSLTPKEGK